MPDRADPREIQAMQRTPRAQRCSTVFVLVALLAAGCTSVHIKSRKGLVDASGFSRIHFAVLHSTSNRASRWFVVEQTDERFLPALEAALAQRLAAQSVMSTSELIDVPPDDPLALERSNRGADILHQVEGHALANHAEATVVVQQTRAGVRTGTAIADNGRDATLDVLLFRPEAAAIIWRASVQVSRTGDVDLAATADEVANKVAPREPGTSGQGQGERPILGALLTSQAHPDYRPGWAGDRARSEGAARTGAVPARMS